MQALLGAVLGRIIGFVISGLIWKVIASFGIGFVVYAGVTELFDGAHAAVNSLYGELPAVISGVVGTLRIDDAISVIFSAISIRLSLKSFGVAGGFASLRAIPPA